MEKKVSVIIPIVEDNTYLSRCLNTLKMQTVAPLEIIVAEQNVEIKGKSADNVFCLSGDDKLISLKTNLDLEYTQNDFFDQLFDEERRIAINVKKAISLASGDCIFFCNVTSTLSPNVIEGLLDAMENEIFGMARVCYMSKGVCKDIESKEMLWGKIFSKKDLEERKLPKWNYLEILRWIDNVQAKFETVNIIDDAIVFDKSYNEVTQKIFTVKLKDDVVKFRKYFYNRMKNGQDLFKHINTYDYIKVNVVTSLIEQCLNDYELVIDLTSKYIVPIFENRTNAKKNRKELLRESLYQFFRSVESHEIYFDMLLMLFRMDRKMYEAYKIDGDMFDRVYQRINGVLSIKGGFEEDDNVQV